MTLGSASYLIATIFLGLAARSCFLPGFRILRRLPWAVVFVISGAAVAHLQPWFLHSWKQISTLWGPEDGRAIGSEHSS